MNDRGHLSSETLDKLLLRSLAPDVEAQARSHLETCATCAADWNQREADARRFEATVFPRTLPQVSARVTRPSLLQQLRARWQLALAPVVLAAGAAGVLLLARPSPEPEFGIKGGPTLQVFALHEETVLQVRSDTRLSPGDRIRFVVEGAHARYLLIASVDGRGTVSIYYPPSATESARLTPGRTQLPGSIELDDAPGPEVLLAYFSDMPLPVAEVRQALAADPQGPVFGVTPLRFSFQKDVK